ncbi:MAG: protein kinase [Sandaracinaceae bacterium]|nr:protein kinase [Sandaracinaceae bacterium]
MSWLRRLFGRRGEPEATEPAAVTDTDATDTTGPAAPAGGEAVDEAPSHRAAARARAPAAPEDPSLALAALADAPPATLDEPTVLDLLERMRAAGREARAIDLVRRLVAGHPGARSVHHRVAEILASRGDDEGAAELLGRFVDAPDAPLDLWMLAAEIAERRGDRTGALALYERVVARDLDYPRARARVRRLREGERHARDLGATLMADGALTRGRYRVERELGRGGAGTVFLAQDLGLGRAIALKVYHRRGRSERDRLLVEARVPARFEHPGVVRIFDLDEGLAAIAMERVLGGSVRRELEKGAIPVERIRRWFETAAETLAHVHERGVVHRDVKPSNLLIRADEHAVLTDFGLACERGAVGAGDAPRAEGTLAYMSPEQRAGAPAEPAMDVFALGVALREVLEHVASPPPPAWAEHVAACVRDEPGARPPAGWLAERLRER